MASTLIAFASNEGQTEKIARRLAELLEARQITVTLTDLDVAGRPANEVAAVDGIILAASVHAGHHQISALNFALAHHDSLVSKPSAFLSVSLAAAGHDARAGAQAEDQIQDFLNQCRWTPKLTLPLGGAIRYSSQPSFVRWWMRLLQRLMGRKLTEQGFPNITQDAEFTDWHRVEDFTNRYLALLSEQESTAAPEAGS